ncbi:hypothetical protein B0H11DRAFT_2085064 [Mycena galericulata]|nr:hypothetical protein B0H11DRAFT_2085064 [Mycena galericulata]
MNNIPNLPKIEGDVDIILDIYSHSSLKNNSPMNEEYGDIDRLAELGGKALEMALTVHFFYKRPMLFASQITDEAKMAISDDKLRDWLAAYGIQTKYRTLPGSPALLDSSEDMRRFFYAYIGALYIRNGNDRVQAWISALVDPNADVNSFGSPPPPQGAPPPLPHSSPQNFGSQNVLAILNEAAQRNGISVTYSADHTGPAHAPTWSVTCLIKGIEKGRGSGSSQKAAKETAARQALQAMGW